CHRAIASGRPVRRSTLPRGHNHEREKLSQAPRSSFQIAAGEEMEWAQDLAVVHHIADSHVCDGFEFVYERLWGRLLVEFFSIQFANENCVFPFAHGVSGPEEELVLRRRGGSEIDDGSLCDGGFGFREVEGYFTSQSVMIRDNERGLAFIKHFFAGFTCDSG